MCVSFVREILCAIEVVAVKGLVKERERERGDEVLCGPDCGDDEPCGWGQILFMTGCAGNRAEGKRGGVI